MALLRSPQGCPWDREQTFDSIKRYTLEETYEVFDAIERRHWPDLKDELGDLLLQVLFYAQMAEEAGYFSIEDVADNLNSKLIRRHPHIFAGGEAVDSTAVLRSWGKIKEAERDGSKTLAAGLLGAAGLLDTVPRSMPALLEAAKLGSRAAKVGFDWPNSRDLFAKLREEVLEVEQELDGSNQEALEEELGDLLFTSVNLARHLRIDSESALRRANARFRRRFRLMEQAGGGATALSSLTASHLDELWADAKQRETAQKLAGDRAEQ